MPRRSDHTEKVDVELRWGDHVELTKESYDDGMTTREHLTLTRRQLRNASHKADRLAKKVKRSRGVLQ